jgi:cytochrome c-type biogenesis protein CcmE
MTPKRRQRLIFVGILLVGVTAAATLAFLAIGENMLYFFSPTQVLAGETPAGRKIRVGGLVVDGSVSRATGDLTVNFDLTDTAKSITVSYTGILPDLFREGQGIVAMGALTSEGLFVADEVLAKHDENYMPPEVAEALKNAKNGEAVAFPHSGYEE